MPPAVPTAYRLAMRRIARSVVVMLLAAVTLSLVPGDAFARKIAVGDSVMRGATNELRARGFRVNTSVSRQFSEAPRLIRSLKRSGHLPRKVVIHLGNNGYIDPADCRRAVRAAGGRRVFLVTLKVPRGWKAANNRRLQTCARRHGAEIIDWADYAVGHPSWFARDHYHLTARGARKYARLISRAT